MHGKGCSDSERDESIQESMQCRKQDICTPHSTLSPAIAVPVHQIHVNR